MKNESLERPEVQAFMRFYLENLDSIAETAQFIPLTDEQTAEADDEARRGRRRR